MHRIEEDTTATSALIDEWRADGLSTRPIRSHRAPRTWLRRHTRAVAALVAGALALGGSAVVDVRPVWVAGETDVLAAPASPELLSELPAEVTDTPVRERDEKRTSRVQRRAVAPKAPRWTGPTKTTRATSCYGARHGKQHRGVDLDGDTGDLVRSVGVGRVVQVGYRYSNAGLTVVVDHGDTLSLYAHLSRAVVKLNQRVTAGAKLGAVGRTGNATGSHLHFGISRTGTLANLWSNLINPVPWLEARGVVVHGRC